MRRIVFPTSLILIIAALLVIIGYLLAGKTEKEPEIAVHTVVREVLPVGEYTSLVYHYTSLIRNENAIEIQGWTIPFTTKKYIFSYTGAIKLGIDATQIQVEQVQQQGKEAIRITFPPIQILSHEVLGATVEVLEQTQNIFNPVQISETFKITEDRKIEQEEIVMDSTVIKEAQESMEQQIGTLIRGLPGIQHRYDVVFSWQEAKKPTREQGAAPQASDDKKPADTPGVVEEPASTSSPDLKKLPDAD